MNCNSNSVSKKQTNIQIYFIPSVPKFGLTTFHTLRLYWKHDFIKLRYVYRLQVRYFEGILNSCSFFLISSFLNRLVQLLCCARECTSNHIFRISYVNSLLNHCIEERNYKSILCQYDTLPIIFVTL